MDKTTRLSIPWLAAVISLLGALALPADDVAALDGRLPDADPVAFETGDSRIVFRPQDEFAGMILTVTGPFGYVFVQEVPTGEEAVFELDPAETLDGSYTWEVRVVPILSEETLGILRRARDSGDDSELRTLMRKGKVPIRARTQGGGFRVVEGVIILGGEPEERRLPSKDPTRDGDVPGKDYVINNDLVVDGSACVGFDCSDGWAFSFTTIGLSEHNTRIKFDDTSYTASYPNNDWQLLANDSTNGGTEKFSIIDCGDNDSQGNCSGSTVFTVEAGADSHSLYVDDAGRVGFGTSTPVVELHVVDGNTPTLRLAQDGSSGFTPQTFDVAGNEANFFIRDATNGSKLPLRIKPGAPTNSLMILDSGYVGMGTASPSYPLHLKQSTGSTATLLGLENNGATKFELINTAGDTWTFNSAANGLRINANGVATTLFLLETDGDLTIEGDIVSNGTTYVPDYVLESDYPLMPLAELASFIAENKHLPNVPAAAEIERQGGVNLSQMQMRLLEKIEELTLYTLDQHRVITAQQETLAAQQEALAAQREAFAIQQQAIAQLRARLEALEQ